MLPFDAASPVRFPLCVNRSLLRNCDQRLANEPAAVIEFDLDGTLRNAKCAARTIGCSSRPGSGDSAEYRWASGHIGTHVASRVTQVGR